MPIRSPVPPVVRDALAERCGGSPTALASMLGISVRLARRVLAGKGVSDDERTLMAMNMRHAIRGTMQARLDTIARSKGGLERLMPRLRLCAEALDRMEAALGEGRETDVCPFPPWSSVHAMREALASVRSTLGVIVSEAPEYADELLRGLDGLRDRLEARELAEAAPLRPTPALERFCASQRQAAARRRRSLASRRRGKGIDGELPL